MNIEQNQYIGILACEKGNQEAFSWEMPFVNQQQEIQYSVRALSKEVLPQQVFSGYINCLDESCDVEDDYYLNDEGRIDNFLSNVKDKLFMFSYMQKGQFHNISEAHLIPIPPSFDWNERFISVPVFSAKDDREARTWENENNISLYREYASFEDFARRIVKRQHVGCVSGYGAEPSMVPAFVVWKETDGTLYAVNTITGIEESGSQKIILDANEIDRIELTRHEDKIVYNEWVNPTLLFLPESTYQEIKEEAELQKEFDEQMTQKPSKPSNPPKLPSTRRDGLEWQYEEQLLSSMKYYCQDRNLQYKESDLVNFHTAVKCSDLVVLSGMSGTGKSALVDVYARALGLTSENRQFLFIPVSPSWNDDADLLGHIDLMNKVYHASDTGFVNLLVEAQKKENQDKLYVVCFDEMNLARVEHYFSQFLSILEKPSDERSLILYDAQYTEKLENAGEYPWKIAIGDNIKFIGTVNVDESTYHFSDKVLDRANVITLDIMDYSSMGEEEVYELERDEEWSASEYKAMVSEYSRNQELRCLLWDLHTILHSANTKLGIGPRIVKCMEQYLANLPEGERIYLAMDEAVDYQIAQRVLTKVRGPETQLGNLLGDNLEAGILSVFDKYSHLSLFKKSRQVIEDKRKELEVYGYCV